MHNIDIFWKIEVAQKLKQLLSLLLQSEIPKELRCYSQRKEYPRSIISNEVGESEIAFCQI